jgi:hypothetical protein
MNNLRHLCAAVVLTLALTLSALAGDMHTLGADQLPPSSDGQIQTGTADGQTSTTIAGQMDTGVAGQMETTVAGQIETLNNVANPVDPVTQMALRVLQSILSLF